ncbi:MAG: dienelactone hydrolase family protein, partial [Anaerolineae bacterium]|nr:dienelactone hydrolase family protein [Anaerolineae bacterium]
MTHATKVNSHQGQPVYTTGKPPDEAKAAMILVHGRGADAQSILELAQELSHPDFVYLAPQASAYSWYPYSFLEPTERNEPGLTSGLQVIGELVTQVKAAGIPAERIVLAGFSQGACLASEFAARHAQRYGGLLVFSGGLIGPPGTVRDYDGSLAGTPVFLGCSDVDFHIPLARVEETAVTFTNLGAHVNKQIYPGMGHTIVFDELEHANKIVQAVIAA